MRSPKIAAARTAIANPAARAIRPRPTAPRSPLSMPSAVAMIAPYSGPTTIAATMRICELVRMPTTPIRPAMTSRVKKLSGYRPSARILASTMSQTGGTSARRGRPAGVPVAAGVAVAVIDTSTYSIEIEPSPASWARRRCSTRFATWSGRSNWTASPSGCRAAPGSRMRLRIPGSAASVSISSPVAPAGLTTRTCSIREPFPSPFRRRLGQPVEDPVADPDGVRHRGEGRVDRADAREDAGVGHVEVVDLVRPAVGVERRRGRVGAAADGPGLMRAAGDRDVGLHVHAPVGEVALVHAERAEHRLELAEQLLGGGRVARPVGDVDAAVRAERHPVVRLR